MHERVRVVRACRGKDAVMASYAGAHAQKMKEPGAIRCEEPRLKIKMKKGVSFRAPVATKEIEKGIAAKVMNDAGRDINLAEMIGGKSVAMDEAARELFGGGKAIRFLDQGGIQLDPGQLDSLRRKRAVGGEPADVVADAAAHIDDAKGAGESAGADGSDYRLQHFSYARAVVELLGEALHFPVNGEEEAIDFERIEKTVHSRERFDSAESLMIVRFREDIEDIPFADRQALESGGIVADDEIGDLWLGGIPRGEHKARVMQGKACERIVIGQGVECGNAY